MSMLRNVGIAVAQQALITGQVRNALSGAGITPASLLVEMRLPGAVAFRPLGAKVRCNSAGYFCISGVAEQVFPQGLAPDAELELRFLVRAPFHADLMTVVMVPAAAISVLAGEEVLAGHSLPLRLISAPALQQDLTLQPIAVGMDGWVVSDHDFNAPLSGISIQVVEPELRPPVVSDAMGRFRIDSLPVAKTVTLQVEGSDISSFTIKHVIDYTMPFNTRIISVNG